MPVSTKLRVFISHASGEAPLAEILQQHMTKDFIGLVEVFVSSDGTSIAVGDHWMDGVVKALQNADVFAVLCSQHSIERRWINIEMGAALARSQPIVQSHSSRTRHPRRQQPTRHHVRYGSHRNGSPQAVWPGTLSPKPSLL